MSIIISPLAGTGSETITVSSTDENTGRDKKVYNYALFATNLPIRKDFVVELSPKEEFLEVQDTVMVPRAGGSVTITGITNTDAINFSFATNGIPLEFSGNYIADGRIVSINQLIPLDPGSTAQFTFSITFDDIPENTTGQPRTTLLRVGNSIVGQHIVEIEQAAEDFTIDKTIIDLDEKGTQQTLNIMSAYPWTITAPVWPDSLDTLTVSPLSGPIGYTIVNVSSVTNEELDRSTTFEIELSDGFIQTVVVNQIGKREIFNAADGEYLTSEGDQILVLKDEFEGQ